MKRIELPIETTAEIDGDRLTFKLSIPSYRTGLVMHMPRNPNHEREESIAFLDGIEFGVTEILKLDPTIAQAFADHLTESDRR